MAILTDTKHYRGQANLQRQIINLNPQFSLSLLCFNDMNVKMWGSNKCKELGGLLKISSAKYVS